MFEGDRHIEEVYNDDENQKDYYVEDDYIDFPRQLFQPKHYSKRA